MAFSHNARALGMSILYVRGSNVLTTPPQRGGMGIRKCYPHSYAISKSRAGVSAGLGGFVGFRQLPR